MAGQPIKRQLLSDIAKKGGIEAICEKIVDGRTIGSIAKDFGVSRQLLSTTLNKTPEHRTALQVAKKQRGETYAEQALQIIDQVEENPNAISKARDQAGIRRWLAGVNDPDTYGQKQQPQIQISVGDLHLSALRQAPPIEQK